MTYNVFGETLDLTQLQLDFDWCVSIDFYGFAAISCRMHFVFGLFMCLSVHACMHGRTLKVCEQNVLQAACGNIDELIRF